MFPFLREAQFERYKLSAGNVGVAMARRDTSMQVSGPGDWGPRAVRVHSRVGEVHLPASRPASPAQCASGRAAGHCPFWPVRGCSPTRARTSSTKPWGAGFPERDASGWAFVERLSGSGSRRDV
jgi:hypothetical protein